MRHYDSLTFISTILFLSSLRKGQNKKENLKFFPNLKYLILPDGGWSSSSLSLRGLVCFLLDMFQSSDVLHQ